MLGKTRLGWISWSSKHQQPGEVWSMHSLITPHGKLSQQEEYIYRKQAENSDRLEFPSWWIAVSRPWSRMPLNRAGRLALKASATGSGQVEAAMMPSRKSIS